MIGNAFRFSDLGLLRVQTRAEWVVHPPRHGRCARGSGSGQVRRQGSRATNLDISFFNECIEIPPWSTRRYHNGRYDSR
jgi:hypothetical protein